MPHSDPTTNESSDSTQPTTTGDGTMSSKQHLNRLAKLTDWLMTRASIDYALNDKQEAKRKYIWAEDVRWAIDREGSRGIEEMRGRK